VSDKTDTSGADCGHVRNVSATERLRELLDERGVKWWPMHNNGYYRERDTEFVVNGKKHTAHEWGDGLAVYNLTPEQAIAATLGRGTCQFKTVKRFIDARRDRADMCECDRCGYRCARGFIQDERFKYCPNCGRKVVGDVLRTE
jgi:hypothetical protein